MAFPEPSSSCTGEVIAVAVAGEGFRPLLSGFAFLLNNLQVNCLLINLITFSSYKWVIYGGKFTVGDHSIFFFCFVYLSNYLFNYLFIYLFFFVFSLESKTFYLKAILNQ